LNEDLVHVLVEADVLAHSWAPQRRDEFVLLATLVFSTRRAQFRASTPTSAWLQVCDGKRCAATFTLGTVSFATTIANNIILVNFSNGTLRVAVRTSRFALLSGRGAAVCASVSERIILERTWTCVITVFVDLIHFWKCVVVFEDAARWFELTLFGSRASWIVFCTAGRTAVCARIEFWLWLSCIARAFFPSISASWAGAEHFNQAL
jgi:hypothetical protein